MLLGAHRDAGLQSQARERGVLRGRWARALKDLTGQPGEGPLPEAQTQTPTRFTSARPARAGGGQVSGRDRSAPFPSGKLFVSSGPGGKGKGKEEARGGATSAVNTKAWAPLRRLWRHRALRNVGGDEAASRGKTASQM